MVRAVRGQALGKQERLAPAGRLHGDYNPRGARYRACRLADPDTRALTTVAMRTCHEPLLYPLSYGGSLASLRRSFRVPVRRFPSSADMRRRQAGSRRLLSAGGVRAAGGAPAARPRRAVRRTAWHGRRPPSRPRGCALLPAAVSVITHARRSSGFRSRFTSPSRTRTRPLNNRRSPPNRVRSPPLPHQKPQDQANSVSRTRKQRPWPEKPCFPRVPATLSLNTRASSGGPTPSFPFVNW